MSTATVPSVSTQSKEIAYIPLGEREQVKLSIGMVRKFLCVPTRSGQNPNDEQVVKFMMLCKAQSLNPWVSDAYLVGYDSKDGPNFSLIVSHQALLKRAEASDDFDGIESGVVVSRDGNIAERPGKVVFEGEEIVGGWARVHRKDRKVATYDSVSLSTYNTGRSRWAADPSGMIVKVAEAAALRKSFPSNLAALYCAEEMDSNDSHVIAAATSVEVLAKPASRAEAAKNRAGIQSEPRGELAQEALSERDTDHEPDQQPEAANQDMATEEEVNRLMEQFKGVETDKAKRMTYYKSVGIDPNKNIWPKSGVEAAWDHISELHDANKS